MKATGRRSRYCGESCASKASRRRRQERQHPAIANVLAASTIAVPADKGVVSRRPESADVDLSSAQGPVAAARDAERLALRFLQRLEQVRAAGEDGEDPRANDALDALDALGRQRDQPDGLRDRQAHRRAPRGAD
ncbi:hypothetical protein, partial [Kitasatospora sp. NPDC001175]|uniref:hypothetical protein n=1 Tax=Kitasatospora sp. NPDC001175 TaxID=3157103 RepID=UPI003CFF30C8